MLNRPQKQWPMVDPVGRWRAARERERASCADYIAVVERDSIIHPRAVWFVLNCTALCELHLGHSNSRSLSLFTTIRRRRRRQLDERLHDRLCRQQTERNSEYNSQDDGDGCIKRSKLCKWLDVSPPLTPNTLHTDTIVFAVAQCKSLQEDILRLKDSTGERENIKKEEEEEEEGGGMMASYRMILQAALLLLLLFHTVQTRSRKQGNATTTRFPSSSSFSSSDDPLRHHRRRRHLLVYEQDVVCLLLLVALVVVVCTGIDSNTTTATIRRMTYCTIRLKCVESMAKSSPRRYLRSFALKQPSWRHTRRHTTCKFHFQRKYQRGTRGGLSGCVYGATALHCTRIKMRSVKRAGGGRLLRGCLLSGRPMASRQPNGNALSLN